MFQINSQPFSMIYKYIVKSRLYKINNREFVRVRLQVMVNGWLREFKVTFAHRQFKKAYQAKSYYMHCIKSSKQNILKVLQRIVIVRHISHKCDKRVLTRKIHNKFIASIQIIPSTNQTVMRFFSNIDKYQMKHLNKQNHSLRYTDKFMSILCLASHQQSKWAIQAYHT